MGTQSFSSAFPILVLIIVGSCLHHQVAADIVIGGGGITIGGSPYPPAPSPEQACPPLPPPPACAPPPPPPPCPPPPSPPPPPPSPPPPSPSPPPPSPPPPSPSPPPPSPPPRPPPISDRILLVHPVIQKFKAQITSDPMGIKKTWNGKDVCKYKGFQCATVPDLKKTALAAVYFNGYGFAGKNGLSINLYHNPLHVPHSLSFKHATNRRD